MRHFDSQLVGNECLKKCLGVLSFVSFARNRALIICLAHAIFRLSTERLKLRCLLQGAGKTLPYNKQFGGRAVPVKALDRHFMCVAAGDWYF
jgi:hypothetical protein